jgi:hypothetical protein
MQGAVDYLYQVMLEDMRQIRDGCPPIGRALHDGRLKYFRHDVGNMKIWTLAQIWQHRGGQCGDLGPAVAAERTLAGRPSFPVAYKSSTPGVIHVVVEDEISGHWLDPSRSGGMARGSTSFLPTVGAR